MRPEEARGLGELIGDAAADVIGRVGEMHAGIAQRAFGSAGPGATPARIVHDSVARTVYATTKRSTRVAIRAAGAVLAATRPPEAPSIEHDPRARIAIGAVNGAFGSALEDRAENPLVLGMTVRARGHDVPLDPVSLHDAFPSATGRLAVFLHGLCETDDAWRLGAERHRPYGERLREEHGFTPLYLRYNTGRRISSNGRELAAVLDAVLAGWPVPVTEIDLVGHSMGGLVARSATHYGVGMAWVPRVRHIVNLGTPHQGARLEQAVHAASRLLRRLPETRMLASALERRSNGIKDLRRGHLVDEDWDREERSDIPFLATANHLFLSASLAGDHDSLPGRLIGDLLVLHASAWDTDGPGKRLRFPIDNYRHIGGVSHFGLLNHPAVYEQLARWMGPGAPALTESAESVLADQRP